MNIPESSSIPVGRRGFDPAVTTSSMDVARSPQVAQKRRRQRWIVGGRGGAWPSPGSRPVWRISARQCRRSNAPRFGPIPSAGGPMLRQVRGMGSFVPEEIRWIAAGTDARVERIVVFPGATVET